MKQIASLGGGKASTAMILMSLHGELDPLDAIIFADTGAERQTTLDTVERLKEYAGGGDLESPFTSSVQTNCRTLSRMPLTRPTSAAICRSLLS